MVTCEPATSVAVYIGDSAIASAELFISLHTATHVFVLVVAVQRRIHIRTMRVSARLSSKTRPVSGLATPVLRMRTVDYSTCRPASRRRAEVGIDLDLHAAGFESPCLLVEPMLAALFCAVI